MSDSSPHLEDHLPDLGNELPIKQPVNVLMRSVKLEAVGLFKGLAKVSSDLGSQKYWGLPGSVFETITAVKVDGLKNPQRAWLLIYRALLRGATELVMPSLHLLDSSENMEKDTRDAFLNNLDVTLGEKEVVVNPDFFKHPERLSVLADFGELMQRWLTEWGMEENRARTIIERLPIFFTVALHNEWRDRTAEYAPLADVFDSPFLKAGENLLAWERYYALLRKQVQESMFGESFSLSQVYVPLRGYYEEESDTKRSGPREEREKEKIRVAVELREELDKWLEKSDSKDTLRVISGGPGSGKSSFARMWAAELTKRPEMHVLFVELHRLNLRHDVEKAVGDFVEKNGILTQNPLDSKEGENRLLIIFDGLDEIAEMGKGSLEMAKDFVTEVRSTLKGSNQGARRLQVLVTGRELVVQTAIHLESTGQVLYVAPYKLNRIEPQINDEKLKLYQDGKENRIYRDEKDLLANDQRNLWWQNYGNVIGKVFEGLPKELRSEELAEVTGQPLLNYLVALSYGRYRACLEGEIPEKPDIDFSQEVSINEIYADLLSKVHEGIHNDKRPHTELDVETFARLLEEVALAVWRGNGRTASLTAIRKQCEEGGLRDLLARLEESAKAGVTQLLLAFYFRQQGRDKEGDQTFEFTHKSFGEYLTARRIVAAIEEIEERFEQEAKMRRGNRYSDADALLTWVKVCGMTAMDFDLFDFLVREVALHGSDDSGREKVARWQKRIADLMGEALSQGLPMTKLGGDPTYKEMARQSRNAEETLLVLHSCCARVTKILSNIEWPNTQSAGNWLSRLQGQRDGPQNHPAFHCLNFLNFSTCILDIKDLYGANLSFSNLKGASLHMANLHVANLESVNLEGATLENVDLESSNLENANLRYSDIIEATFTGANLCNANLNGVTAVRTNFENANFAGAILDDAHFDDAIVARKQLTGVQIASLRTRPIFEDEN